MLDDKPITLARRLEVAAIWLFVAVHVVLALVAAVMVGPAVFVIGLYWLDGAQKGQLHMSWMDVFGYLVMASWPLAFIFSMVAPIKRRRFDLRAVAGAIYVTATCLIWELYLDPIREEKHGLYLFWWYALLVMLPTVFAMLIIDRVKPVPAAA